MRKKAAARPEVIVLSVIVMASSTASRPNRVVNLMTGFIATEEVSLNGSPTVSPMTVAACSSVPFMLSSVSTSFFALSQAPPALRLDVALDEIARAVGAGGDGLRGRAGEPEDHRPAGDQPQQEDRVQDRQPGRDVGLAEHLFQHLDDGEDERRGPDDGRPDEHRF